MHHGGAKHYSPSKIMTRRCIHANNVVLSFGVYGQIAENVEPQNNLDPRTRGPILLGDSGNLSGGQMFLVGQFYWLGEPSILTSTNRHGQDISDNPQDADLDGNEVLESVFAHPTGNTGVCPVVEGNDIKGVDQDFVVEPTGVDIEEA